MCLHDGLLSKSRERYSTVQYIRIMDIKYIIDSFLADCSYTKTITRFYILLRGIQLTLFQRYRGSTAKMVSSYKFFT
jgi:hypothetical protein